VDTQHGSDLLNQISIRGHFVSHDASTWTMLRPGLDVQCTALLARFQTDEDEEGERRKVRMWNPVPNQPA
jgi:hypothetical protein